MYKTMNKLNINQSSNKNLNYSKLMNLNTGFNFTKNNNDIFKTQKYPEFNIYVKKIINEIN